MKQLQFILNCSFKATAKKENVNLDEVKSSADLLEQVLTDFGLSITLSFFFGISAPGLEMLSPRVQITDSVPRGSFSS